MRNACLALVLVAACQGQAVVDQGADSDGAPCPADSGAPSDAADASAPSSSDADGAASPDVTEASESGAEVDAGEPESEAGAGGDAAADAPVSDVAAGDARGPESDAATCSDHKTDGDETDIDCGGSVCPPCGRGEACLVDSDCSATATGCDVALGGCSCDAVSMTCAYDSCVDHKLDGTETAIDCGGSVCPSCAEGLACLVDGDCASEGCDAITKTCAPGPCGDHQKDGDETDIDCGGGECAGCAIGQSCFISYDCASQACDALTLTCIQDQCADHEQDGNETDTDCGGMDSCPRCPGGERCEVSTDCAAGLSCNPSYEHVCQ